MYKMDNMSDDIFNEQIVARKISGIDKAEIAGIFILALALSIAVFVFLWKIIMLFTIFIVAGIFYGAYKLVMRKTVEYEYIVTNDQMDIDEIIAKSSRKRLITVSTKETTSFGKYNENAFEGKTFGQKIIATTNSGNENVYYMVCNHKSKGQVLIVFEPNDKILDGLKKYIPRSILS